MKRTASLGTKHLATRTMWLPLITASYMLYDLPESYYTFRKR